MGRDLDKAKERKRRWRAKKHEERYGPNAGNQRGKHGNNLKGPDHPHYNCGISTHSDGYLKVQVGLEHQLADPIGNAYLHLLVWVAGGNNVPGPGWVLHHKNEIKTDNRLENLELLTRSQHAKLHNECRGRNPDGTFKD